MSVLLGVILLFAVLALAVAVRQALVIIAMAPASERLAGFMPLGWWKFRQIAEKAGPASAQPLDIYKRAVIAFIVFLLMGVILSGWTVNQRTAPATAAWTNTTGAAAGFAFNTDLRRAATMPGAPIVES